MRAAFSSWVGLGWLGLGLFAACLPEVTIDDSLTETGMAPLQGGSAGTAGKGPSSAGTGGAAGAATTPSAGGAGAGGSAASTDTSGGAQGGISLIDQTGSGGAAGAGPMSGGSGGTTSAAGSAGAPPANAGEDVCPSDVTVEIACDKYCALYTEACSDSPAYDYLGATDCSTICQSLGWQIGTISQPNSILCRCNHAYKAKVFGQDPHCYHSARVPQKTGGCEIPPP